MSYTFSRRSFLKYTALSVAAIAGASMLSGCETTDPNNPVATKPGESVTILNIRGTLDNVNTKTGVFTFTVKSSYDLPIYLDPDCFSVSVRDKNDTNNSNPVYYSGNHRGVELQILEGAPNRPRLNKNETAVLQITAPEFVAPKAGETIVFQYMPARSTANCSMIWEITIAENGSSSIEGSTSSKAQ